MTSPWLTSWNLKACTLLPVLPASNMIPKRRFSDVAPSVPVNRGLWLEREKETDVSLLKILGPQKQVCFVSAKPRATPPMTICVERGGSRVATTKTTTTMKRFHPGLQPRPAQKDEWWTGFQGVYLTGPTAIQVKYWFGSKRNIFGCMCKRNNCSNRQRGTKLTLRPWRIVEAINSARVKIVISITATVLDLLDNFLFQSITSKDAQAMATQR